MRKPPVLVSSGCCYAFTKPRSMDGLNKGNLFLLVLGATSPRARCWLIPFAGTPLFLAYRQPPAGCVLKWPFFGVSVSGELSFFLFLGSRGSYRIGSHLTTSFNLNSFLKAPSPNTVTLGLGLPRVNLGGCASVRSTDRRK